MKIGYKKYIVLFFFLIVQNAFSAQTDNSGHISIDVQAFPTNNINYFNTTESWRLVYGKLGNQPPYDPTNKNHCNTSETAPDYVLAFNISEILKNAGDTFSEQYLHVYYDGDAGEKALALQLNDGKIKNSVLRMTEVFIRKENSKFAKLTSDRLLKKLILLNDNEENMMYVCFGYLQHLIAAPIQEQLGFINPSEQSNPRIDPQKIVLWYEASKATPKSSR